MDFVLNKVAWTVTYYSQMRQCILNQNKIFSNFKLGALVNCKFK